MWGLVTAALATMNPLCVGTCSDSSECASSSDCGGETCAFADDCLPGLSDLIGAVEPELPNALNTYDSGWECGYLDCVAGPDALSFTSAYGFFTAATKDFVVPSGRTYLLRAWLGADPDGYGYLDVLASDVYAESPWVWDAPEPVPVTITFEVPSTHTGPIDLRLHSGGAGYLHLSDVVVYELVDYGVWVRFAVPDAAGPVRFVDDWILRHGISAGDPHGYYPYPCVGPVGPTCIDPALVETVAPPGAFSPWVQVSAMFEGGWRASHSWTVADAATDAPLFGQTVQVQMAWAPDEAAVLWDETRALATDLVGIVLPDGVPAPLDLLVHRGFIADTALADLPLLSADPAWAPAEVPSLYWTGSVLGRIDLFDAPYVADDTIDLFHALGFNRRSFLTESPSPDVVARAAALGMDKDLLHGEQILAPWNYTTTDLDLVALRQTADETLGQPKYGDVAQDFVDHPDDLFVIMGDEIGGLLFEGPLYEEGFRDFLNAQGVTPADVGVTDFAQVVPLSNMAWWRVPDLRPNPLAEPAGAALFYWQLRWWNEATGQAYGVVRDAIEQRPGWGAPYPSSFNAGTPFAPHYFTYRLGTEFQTMARAGAVSAYFGEGFLLFNDQCRAQQLAWFADFSAGEARPWGFEKHGYLHASRGDQVSKVLTLASRGFRYIDTYMYGPYDLTTGDGMGGLGPLSTGWLKRVTASHDALAKAEPWLFGATRHPSPVAIVAAQADPVWTDLGVSTENEAGWHLAWTHGHQPVDFIVEEHLADELDGRSVLLFDRLHASTDAWDAITAWVEAGGTLILGRGLAARDEFGQPVPARDAWLGVTAGRASYGKVEPARVDWGGSIEITTWWSALSGGTTLASYQDGQPAVVEVLHGKGRAVVVGFDLGDQYTKPITEACFQVVPAEIAPFPEGYSETIRAAAESLVPVAPLEVDADDPLVEVTRVHRDDGGAIVALSYNNAAVTVTITAPDLPDEVTEALSGQTLPVIDGTVTLVLDSAAVLGWTVLGPIGTTPTSPGPTTPTTTEDTPSLPPPTEPDGGCGCAAAETGWSAVSAALLLLVWRRRRPQRQAPGQRED